MTQSMSETELRARFDALTEPVDGGHLTWTGPAQITWRGQHWRPAALAFYMRTGRRADGYTRPDCDHPGCVQPSHVDDATGRKSTREALRGLLGIPHQDACRRGHPQAEHGRYRPTGIAYCEACRIERHPTPDSERTSP
jgi:hypothetical protein